MKATDLLIKQHTLVDSLFRKLEQAKDKDTKIEIFEQIAANLVAHDAIEREIFYPACEREIEDEDVLGESLVEHGVVEFCLFRADQKRRSDELDEYAKVLKEVVQHHVQEEQRELLPKVERAMESETLETLGAKMEARFAEAMKSDFRRPLRDNLTQVLQGRTKTKKSKAPARTRPRTQRSTTTRRASAKKARSGKGTRGRTAARKAAR